jgi:hypothetical protein
MGTLFNVAPTKDAMPRQHVVVDIDLDQLDVDVAVAV